jgi:hypothetical protein
MRRYLIIGIAALALFLGQNAYVLGGDGDGDVPEQPTIVDVIEVLPDGVVDNNLQLLTSTVQEALVFITDVDAAALPDSPALTVEAIAVGASDVIDSSCGDCSLVDAGVKWQFNWGTRQTAMITLERVTAAGTDISANAFGLMKATSITVVPGTEE